MDKSFWKELWNLMICAFIGIAIVMVVATVLVLSGLNPGSSAYAHTLQWMQTFLVMLLPALLWYKWRFGNNPFTAFSFKWSGWRTLVLTAILMVCSIPALDYITVLNATMPMPQALRDMADEMRREESVSLARMLALGGIGGWIELVLLMSIGTAVAEETMFRGALVKCFSLTKLNHHWVAISVGFIFSFIHFDPLGFVPRWLLGSLFCYLVFWTGSIWPSILAHATNNLVALIQFKSADDPALLYTTEPSFSWYIGLLSALVSSVIVYILCTRDQSPEYTKTKGL